MPGNPSRSTFWGSSPSFMQIVIQRGDCEQAVAERDANPESQVRHQSKSRLLTAAEEAGPATTSAPRSIDSSIRAESDRYPKPC